ncbi:MAG: 2-oxoglutarate dehydrogenase E1 component [Ktedonobacterales bacterium]|nr:2-oxoglutarate dehydrogenase E1 component [Ktedonobacterales bacterium]
MSISWDTLYGPNLGYALDLYERYQRDPDAVDPAARALFARMPPPPEVLAPTDGPQLSTETASLNGGVAAHAPEASMAARVIPAAGIADVVAAARLARGIREYGHLDAHIDPFDAPRPGDPMLNPTTHGLTGAAMEALPASIVWPSASQEPGTFLGAIARLRAIYSGPIGYDFDHVQDFDERAWLRETVEADAHWPVLTTDERRELLGRLTEVEEFEHFLHSTFPGQKRFSIEGTDLLVPMLDRLIHDAALAGTREVVIGMAHRGRLTVLAHILGKPYAAIFSEFHAAPNKELVPSEGSMGINYGWTGDVKYHLGARTIAQEEGAIQVQLTLSHNPSHLEFVNPVIAGITRAAQERRDAPGAPSQHVDAALAVAIHGDAAFPGEGVVAETLNLSRLPGYAIGGTIHLIVNNQIGFTTEAPDARSTLYASDLAKGFEIPIVHVNADDPEACLATIRLAQAYRYRFHKDFLIDLVGYRRWGHNEGDEPSFTQPRLAAAITTHPTVRTLYAKRLARKGIETAEHAEHQRQASQAHLRAAYDALADGRYHPDEPPPLLMAPPLTQPTTAVPAETLRALNAALLARPESFTPHARLERLLQRRREALEKPGGIEWALAESLAFAAILADGTPIRFSGQDTERGTFSQRHLVLHDAQTGARYVPLQALPQARASFAVYNSPLSEAAPLGFEYGYSVYATEALVLWEAQFGDFANAGQVLIDQFIAAARAKWRQLPSLALLLPHGYEGQGPEHSSGRVERYLQLAAEDNLRIVNCTTAAQYFSLLRLHAALLRTAPRPLIVLTPKSLLRHPRAGSRLRELAEGRFQPVLDDAGAAARREGVERLILCSGKVAVDLDTARDAAGAGSEGALERIAVARVEQLYPFPEEALRHVIARYPHLRELVWLQEEPRNMGAWHYLAPCLRALLPARGRLRYLGRPERASTAEGSAEIHATEQARILEAAFADTRAVRMGRQGGQHAE